MRAAGAWFASRHRAADPPSAHGSPLGFGRPMVCSRQAATGGPRKRSIRRRIAANSVRGTATSASWNTRYRPCCTIRAQILAHSQVVAPAATSARPRAAMRVPISRSWRPEGSTCSRADRPEQASGLVEGQEADGLGRRARHAGTLGEPRTARNNRSGQFRPTATQPDQPINTIEASAFFTKLVSLSFPQFGEIGGNAGIDDGVVGGRSDGHRLLDEAVKQEATGL